MSEEKQCSTCLVFKPVDEFQKRRNQCKCCIFEYNRKWREANREKAREHARKYYEANRKEVLDRNKNYYEANREEIININRKWREVNREKMREHKRRSQALKREAKNQQSVFRALSPEKMEELKAKLSTIKPIKE